ncbi:hypothetical protein BDD12DRAFT_19582 [Trichophaea hybrida]|nr:hypothetical protein BDD12DRAFT_19582 [Trichophaea hybrida]
MHTRYRGNSNAYCTSKVPLRQIHQKIHRWCTSLRVSQFIQSALPRVISVMAKRLFPAAT